MLRSGVKADNITDVIPTFLELSSSQKFYIHTPGRIYNIPSSLLFARPKCSTEKALGSIFPKPREAKEKKNSPLAEYTYLTGQHSD